MYSYFSNIIKWISDRFTGVKNMVATSRGDSVKQAPVTLCDRGEASTKGSDRGALGACDPGTGRADSRSEGGGGDREAAAPFGGDTEELWLTTPDGCLTEPLLPVYLRSDQTALNLKN